MAKKAFDTSSNPLDDFITPKVVELKKEVIQPPTQTTVVESKTQNKEETKVEIKGESTSTPELTDEQTVKQSGKPGENSIPQSASKASTKKLVGLTQKRSPKAVEETQPGTAGRKVSKLPAVPKSINIGWWCDQTIILLRNKRRKDGEFEINTRDIIEEAIEDLAHKYKLKPVEGVFPRPVLEVTEE